MSIVKEHSFKDDFKIVLFLQVSIETKKKNSLGCRKGSLKEGFLLSFFILWSSQKFTKFPINK